MIKYLVKSIDGKYTIQADTWSVGVEGLKFYTWDHLTQQVLGDGVEDKKEYTRWVVAWFKTWDYWMLKEDEQ
jgi:hypothetical protein